MVSLPCVRHEGKIMRLLIVAMADSVHTVRWLNQLADQEWEIHLFPSIDNGIIHPDFKNVTIHSLFRVSLQNKVGNVRLRGIPVGTKLFAQAASRAVNLFFPKYHMEKLTRLIQGLKPDVLHSMETQAAGYLVVSVKEKLASLFPPWIHTVWGSDIYLFGRLASHKDRIRNVLENCDYLICEGQRDVYLAHEFGLRGEMLLVSQATGGFDIPRCVSLRDQGLTSHRCNIMLKGYQSWAGRALVGLRALERCAELLTGYTVIIYSATPDVALAAELFTAKTGVLTEVIPQIAHDEMLRLQGKARLSISLSISDGVPNSLMEAMAMGSFPIQSWTACTDEWIEDGRTGLLVPPEDPDIVEQAIRRALTDDDLVDIAAAENWRTIEDRLDYTNLKQKAIELYVSVAGH